MQDAYDTDMEADQREMDRAEDEQTELQESLRWLWPQRHHAYFRAWLREVIAELREFN